MNMVVDSSRPEAPESTRSAFIEDDEPVRGRSQPPVGRPPMRSILLRPGEVEDVPPVRDVSTER